VCPSGGGEGEWSKSLNARVAGRHTSDSKGRIEKGGASRRKDSGGLVREAHAPRGLAKGVLHGIGGKRSKKGNPLRGRFTWDTSKGFFPLKVLAEDAGESERTSHIKCLR